MTVADPVAGLPERERNRRLRRVDWRFLLSTPLPERLLCLGDADLRGSCELIAAHVDAAPATDARRYDVVVVQNPDERSLTQAFASLRAGGELYGEWHSHSAGQVRALLRNAGFVAIRDYWPWPAPPDAEVWVPLHAPQAFDYFVTVDRHVYSGVRHRIGTRARRLLARRRLASGRIAPVCAVARAPDQGSAVDDASPTILRRIRALTAPTRTPDHFACALLTGGPQAISKVVGLVYEDGKQSPSCVVKWPRVRDSEAGLANEANVLHACHTRGPAPGVPRVLATTGSGLTLAVAESAAKGAPMFAKLAASNFASLSQLGAAWLTDFNVAHGGARASAAMLRERCDSAIARFADTFGEIIDRRLLDDAAILMRPLRDVPAVIEHRDYGPWNIFIDDAGQLTVLDWESSRLDGLPLLDLIYFITYMAFFLDGAMVSRRFGDAYRASLDPGTATGALRHRLVEQYRQRFGIADTSMSALRVLCWLEHAESEFQAFTTEAAGPPPAELLRRSVFARLWAEEVTCLRR
jgi:hypothetical protein